MMEITVKTQAENLSITLKGMLDTFHSDEVKECLEKQGGYKNIILNMENVDYISSAGLRVLLEMNDKAKMQNGKFVIEKPSEFVMEILSTVGFDTLLEIKK